MSIKVSEQTSSFKTEPIRCAVISGSSREGSESARVAAYLAARCQLLGGEGAFLLDLARTILPPCDQGDAPASAWAQVAPALQQCDALVVVCPEWGGMAPAALKNFFLLCQNDEIAHKPACLVGVSAGLGGAYPIAELRMSSYKNTHVCYIPEQIIVRNVEQSLHGEARSDGEAALRERIDYALGVLFAYAGSLRLVRAGGALDLARYPYGA